MATHRHGSSRPGHRNPGRRQRHHTQDRPERTLRELRNGQGVALNCLEVGTIVLARIPFAESNDTKVRPAVVVHASRSAVVVRPVTTSIAMRRRARVVRELVLDRRRCWEIDRLIQIPLVSVVRLIARQGVETAAAA